MSGKLEEKLKKRNKIFYEKTGRLKMP